MRIIQSIIIVFIFSSLLCAQEQADSLVRYYYPNGQVSSEGIMQNGKPDGFWRTYYVSGVVKSEGRRVNFLLDSTWNFYNQTGDMNLQISYLFGQRNGYTLKYSFENPDHPGEATLISKELFVMGKREGGSYYYHPGGELKLIVFYNNGRKQGISREFDRDSSLISVVSYRDDYVVDRERVNRKDQEGNKQGLYREYYANGVLKTESHYLDDELHGYYREFNGNGELTQALRYERGMMREEIDEDLKELLDMKSTYDEQGRLIFTGAYRDGMPVGIHRFYDTTGNVENAYLYNELGQRVSEGIIDEQGGRTGAWTEFYPEGQVRAKGFYLDNRRNASWVFYYADGSIEQKGRFEKGRYTGLWLWYYPGGRIWREESYFRGREDGSFTEYDTRGEILSRGDYISGEREGEWYYQVGEHREEGAYIIGLKEGLWHYYYPDGTLKFEGLYTQGNPDKRHKYYYPDGTLKEEQYFEMGIRERNWKKYNEAGELVMTINYKKNVEQRINGFKIKLPDDDVKLIK